jgi:hypothetical protein
MLKFTSILYFIVLFFRLHQNKNQNIKVCICTIGKEENRYIREFVTYYEKFGVDTIFLYDNNDNDNEYFDDVIKDYIDKGFVKVFNWRGIQRPHFKAINDCYVKFNMFYDWLIFYDIDEFIHLSNYINIKDFLNERKFSRCKKIYLNWVMHTDNDLISYENLSLFKRFPQVERDAIIDNNFSQKVKSILRGNISKFIIANNSHTSHVITDSVKACNGFGKIINLDEEFYLKNSDSKYYYIDHFFTKSLEEFVNKIKRGSAVNGKDEKFKLFRIIRYFNINKLRNIKYKYIIKNLGINFVIKNRSSL